MWFIQLIQHLHEQFKHLCEAVGTWLISEWQFYVSVKKMFTKFLSIYCLLYLSSDIIKGKIFLIFSIIINCHTAKLPNLLAGEVSRTSTFKNSFGQLLLHWVNQMDRNSHRKCSVRKGVLRNFAKFTATHLCQGLFINKVVGLSLRLY